jgi:hypothetical protein
MSGILMWRSDRVSGALLFLLALFVLWQNLSYPLGSLAEPGAGFVPLLLGIALAVVGGSIALTGGTSAPLKSLGWTEAPKGLAIFAALIFATLALEQIGYRLTIFSVLVFLIGVVERKPAIPMLATAAGFSVLSYFVFHNLLEVQLPLGPFGI